MTSPKLSKDDVDYRKARGQMKCGNCSMFRPQLHRSGPPSSCTLVKGVIDANDVCNRYEPDAA